MFIVTMGKKFHYFLNGSLRILKTPLYIVNILEGELAMYSIIFPQLIHPGKPPTPYPFKEHLKETEIQESIGIAEWTQPKFASDSPDPRWLSGEDLACQCRRREFRPWVRKISQRRKWEPTPVSLPGEFHGQRSLVGYSPRSCKRVRHDLATKQQQQHDKMFILISLIPRCAIPVSFCSSTCRMGPIVASAWGIIWGWNGTRGVETLLRCLASCRQWVIASDGLLPPWPGSGVPGALPLCPVFGSAVVIDGPGARRRNRERFSVRSSVPTARQLPCHQEWFQHKGRGGCVG